MTVDYEALSAENRLEYGRAIGRIGKMLLADRYDKRTHFIYEVLQNAEDALRRRSGWTGSRRVKFALTATELRISHYGAPFNENDVRGICGIDESTKDVTSIGRFGIGFKSVYALTERPEIHSGAEDFAITEYVLPAQAQPVARDPDETLILLPLRSNDQTAFSEIAQGLRDLGAEALLFLKHVDEIVWSVEGQNAGRYRRVVRGDGFMKEVELVTADANGARREEYVLFSCDVDHEGKTVGQAEIAFLTTTQEGRRSIKAIPDARLIVFFPTVLPTHTGFLVQGPYQTTPSRDNIPADKPWNAELARLTGQLLVDVILHMRDTGLLDVATLRVLPLDRQKLSSSLFAPLFERTVAAFRTERVIPTHAGRFASASEVRLARAQDVRALFGPKQLGRLLGATGSAHWADPEITADRAPHLRTFFMQELKIAELTLDMVLARIDEAFLFEQSDAWMLRFYKLLAQQPALWRGRAKEMPLIRLNDGRQVTLMKNGLRQAFLPLGEKTGFPTVRAVLCTSQTIKFLQGIGLTTPDPVDDVIHNILPNYKQETVSLESYAEDIARMLRAFQTDSQTQREKLIAALRSSSIVMAKDAGTGESYITKPTEVYLPSARMTELFRGAGGVSIADYTYECLRGVKVREMLEACGATRILRTERCSSDLSEERRRAARRRAGWERATSEDTIPDVDVAGLQELLELLPSLSESEAAKRAALLWEALIELVERRGGSVVTVPYTWYYHQRRSTTIDAGFVRRLNETAWITDHTGELRRPAETFFSDLNWPPNPVLESRISFKPPAIAVLAKEVGIDPDVLDELKRLGVTDLDQLRARLKVDLQEEVGGDEDRGLERGSDTDAGDANDATELDEDEKDAGEGGFDADADADADADDGASDAGGGSGDERNRRGQSGGQVGSGQGKSGGLDSESSSGHRGREGGGSRGEAGGTREFISYVGVRVDGEGSDPDGLAHRERMALEEKAIALIVHREPLLRRAPAGNEGFDLFEDDVAGEPHRWVEVKAMKGSLKDRPVGLSRAQMEHARRHGDQCWLYIVEHAGDDESARILKIRNPHGAAGTFTFDRGWAAIAEVSEPCPVQDAAE